ncbi:flavodoxin family protein [Spirochaetia bacterium]|nr:flavodoxin family protein [Spirochaetia bacterium]
MNYLIISGNPKQNNVSIDGLCQSVTERVKAGAQDGGATVTELTVEKLSRCHVCADGWGTCRSEHRCAFDSDGFAKAQETIRNADAFCFITPVYWGEMAEALKSFFDRLRRCEASRQFTGESKSILSGKQTLLVASPGGSGNGMLSCLDQMDRFCRHTGAVIFDYIGINRWNNDYKKDAVYHAARAMAEGRHNGETLK